MRRSAAVAVAGVLVGLLPAAPAVAAVAAKPTHVAIVIVGHGVACVPWHSGITGDEVLNDVATVKYRPTDGLITQIDGTPGNNRADETHYWSYWHNTGAGWRYSTTGASSYLPKAGTVEGWHFINGSSTATPPPIRSYASICHDTVVPAPVVPPTTSIPGTAHASTARPATSTVPMAGRTSTTAPSSTAASSPARARATSSTRTAVPAVVTPTVSSAAAALPTLNARNTAEAAHPADDGSAVPTVLVVAIVLVLGGVAAFVTQRRRRSA
jgi:hypothetical protein